MGLSSRERVTYMMGTQSTYNRMGNLFIRENKPIGRTAAALNHVIHYKLERFVDNHHRDE